MLTHEELEARLGPDGRELQRQLLQDHLDRRAALEERLKCVADANGARRRSIEEDHVRILTTVFGDVEVSRLCYRSKAKANLHPADGVLNLPVGQHSHGLSELAAIESTRGSYEEAMAAIARSSGVRLGKRQVEQLAARAAADVEGFYAQACRPAGSSDDLLVISADGKGIVMRPESLRAETARAATSHKLKTRLSKGERRGRKRMAELAVVYDASPVTRRPSDILGGNELSEQVPPAPKATGKWLTASVVEDAVVVLERAFTEAERRDPGHHRTWVVLVDGNNHQIASIKATARAYGAAITIVVDFVHVLEYLWRAAWCFFDEGDGQAETWVAEKALAVLSGRAGIVAGSISRKATALGLAKARRHKADQCARYLLAKRGYLDYPTALAKGWPIATGVIEGACRHLVRDRFDITGARWGLRGAEAILALRAVRTNGDWEAYWGFHLARERQRVHESRYLNGVIPRAA